MAGFAVEIDEGAEAAVLAADDGDHEGETQEAGAGEGRRGATDADPNGQWVLQWARIDALAGEGGAMLAGPVDVVAFADLEEEVELFGEEGVVVFEFEAEERVGLDEGAAAGDDLSTAVGDEVESGEVLEDADGVGGAEDGDGRGEADAFGARGGGGENDGGGGVEVLGAGVLPDAEDVEADLVGVLDLNEEVAELLGRAEGDAGDGV